MIASRPAVRHHGGTRRPSASYYGFRCASCGRRAADVAPCARCGWNCHVNDPTCHRVHLPRTFAAAVARSEACRLEGTSAYRCLVQKGSGYSEKYYYGCRPSTTAPESMPILAETLGRTGCSLSLAIASKIARPAPDRRTAPSDGAVRRLGNRVAQPLHESARQCRVVPHIARRTWPRMGYQNCTFGIAAGRELRTECRTSRP
jgi:hypothetical protein